MSLMTEDELEAFREVSTTAAPLNNIHPLKLDRWWKALVGAPEPIYMQMGSAEIYNQVDHATRAIKAMIDLLGAGNLPLPHREIAQRHIQKFHLHVPRGDGEGAMPFLISWNKENSNWELSTPLLEDAKKIVNSLEQANKVLGNWAVEVQAQLAEKTEES